MIGPLQSGSYEKLPIALSHQTREEFDSLTEFKPCSYEEVRSLFSIENNDPFKTADLALKSVERDSLEIGDNFLNAFSIPREMSKKIIDAYRNLNKLSKEIDAEDVIKASTESLNKVNVVQPISLTEKEFAFLRNFKTLMDTIIEARKYQNDTNMVEPNDTRVEKFKYVDDCIIQSLHDQAFIEATLMKIIKEMIFQDPTIVKERIDQPTREVEFSTHDEVEGEPLNPEQLGALFATIDEAYEQPEQLVSKAFSINLPILGELKFFTFTLQPIMEGDPGAIFMDYFHDQVDLYEAIQGKEKQDLCFNIGQPYEGSDPHSAYDAKYFKVYGQALKLFDQVFNK